MKNITVIGAGTMGNGIAHVFAQSGFSVHLFDINESALERALSTITKNMDRQIAKEKLTETDKASALSLLMTGTNLEEAVASADLVVEAATENTAIKFQLFKDIDAHAPAHCILASNTSSISITKIAAQTTRPDKVIGMHFMNPVPVMRLVEIIRGYSTSDEVCDAVIELSKALGKTPVACNDYPGFVANRILMPMINEAIISLHEGVADVQAIDSIMKLGMAHPMGPATTGRFYWTRCLSIHSQCTLRWSRKS
jgi:3-hydroxybutyryl-CoA dehydrogenase